MRYKFISSKSYFNKKSYSLILKTKKNPNFAMTE